MFLFGRLEKAARVDSLFQGKGKAARAPSTGGGGGSPDPGAGTQSTDKADGKPAEKMPAPDPSTLQTVFQGMVDPAVPDQKKKKLSVDSGAPEPATARKADIEEAPDGPAVAGPTAAPAVAPALEGGPKKKKAAKGEEPETKGEEIEEENGEKKKAKGKEGAVTDEVQAQQKKVAAGPVGAPAEQGQSPKAPGSASEPAVADAKVVTGDFNDSRGGNAPGGATAHALFHNEIGTDEDDFYEPPPLVEPGTSHHHANTAAKPAAKPAAKTAAKPAAAPAAGGGHANASAIGPAITAAATPVVAAGEPAEIEMEPVDVAAEREAEKKKPATAAKAAKAAKADDDETWGTDEDAATMPAAIQAFLAPITGGKEAAGGHHETEGKPTPGAAATANLPPFVLDMMGMGGLKGAAPAGAQLAGLVAPAGAPGAMPAVAAQAPAAAAAMQQGSQQTGADLTKTVTQAHAAVSGAVAAPLPDVGQAEPASFEHVKSAFAGYSGGGGGGGKGAPQPDPMSDADRRMAELQGKADWAQEVVFDDQLAKAQQLGDVADAKASTIDSYSAVEEEKAAAAQKKAEAEAHAQVADEKGKQEVTIESLKAELAASVETEKQELGTQNDKAKTDVHSRFDEQRQTLSNKRITEEVRISSDTMVRTAQLTGDMAAQKKGMQDHIKAQQDLMKVQAGVEKVTNINTAMTDYAKCVSDGETQAGKTIEAGETEAGKISKKGDDDIRAARQKGRDKAAQARAEAAAKVAKSRADDEDKSWIEKVFNGGVDPDEEYEDAEIRAQMAIDAAEDAATKLKEQADASAAKARSDAEAMAERERKSAKAQGDKVQNQATASNILIDQKVMLSEIKSQTDAAVKSTEMDAELKQMIADAQAASEKARADNQLSIDSAIAKLETDEAKAITKLETDLTRSLADVQKKFDATEKKLESGKASDLKRLEKLVHKAVADIDDASMEAARHVDRIRKEAEAQAKADVARQLKEIARHTAHAMAEIDHMADKARKSIHAAAKAAHALLDIDGKEGMTSVEKEGAAQTAAIDAQFQASEKKIGDDGARDRANLEKHTAAIFGELDATNAALGTEMDQILSADLTDAKKAAADIEEAMDGWGTDEDAIYAALKSLGNDPIKMRALKAAYKKKFGKELDAELEDEMSGTELRRAKALESQDPVRIAVAQLDDAANGGVMGAGTNEALITQTLEEAKNMTPEQQKKLAKEYQRVTGMRLKSMLKDELSGGELDDALGQLDELAKPDSEIPVEVKPEERPAIEDKVRKDVGELRKAFNGAGTAEKDVYKALKGKSQKEIQVIKDMYLEEYGEELQDRMEDEMSGTELKEAAAYITTGADHDVDVAVARLQNAADGMGTDEDKIYETLEDIEDPEMRLKVMREYERQTGVKLTHMIADEMSSGEKDLADSLLIPDNHERTITSAAIKLDNAADGGAWGTGLGTDEDAIYKVLEKAKTQKERDEIAAAYEKRTGKTLDKMLHDEMGGAEYDVAHCLQIGDEEGATVAKIKNAADGVGTDEKAIFKELGKYPDDPKHPENAEKRKKLEALYNEKYGSGASPPGMDLKDMLADEMSDMDLKKAEELRETGACSPVTEIEWAMDGVGTDEDAIKEVLKGKSKQEIADLTKAWNDAHPNGPELKAALEDEMSGRDMHDVNMALMGKPETPGEMLEQARLNYEYERGSGSNGFSTGVTDFMGGDAGGDLDRDHRKLQALQAKLEQDGKIRVTEDGKIVDVLGEDGKLIGLDPEDERKLHCGTAWQEINVDNYQAAKDATTKVLAQVGMIVAAVVVTVLTAGAAAPAIGAAAVGLEAGAEIAVEVVAEVVVEALAEEAAVALVEVGTEAIVELGTEALVEGTIELAGEVAVEAGTEVVGEGMVTEAVAGTIEQAAPELLSEAAGEVAAEEAAIEAGEQVVVETVAETAGEGATETVASEAAAETVAEEGVAEGGAEAAAEEGVAEGGAESAAEEGVAEEAAAEEGVAEGGTEAAAEEGAGENVAEEGAEKAAENAHKTMPKWQQKALSQLAGGATNVTIRKGMGGDAYGIEDMGIDIGTALLNAVTAGLLETDKLKGLLTVFAGDPTKLTMFEQLVNAGVVGMAGGVMNSFNEVIWNDELWRSGDIVKELFIAMGKGALTGTVGGLFGHIQNTAFDGLDMTSLALGTPLTATQAFIRGSVTGLLGAVIPMAISGIWNPSVFEGDFGDILKNFTLAGVGGLLQGGADGLGSFIDEPYQAARAAAEKDAQRPDSTAESQAAAAKEAFTSSLEERATKLAERHAGPEEHPETKANGQETETGKHADPEAVAKGAAEGEKEALPKIEAQTEADTKQAVAAEPAAAPTTEEAPTPVVHDQAEAVATEMVTQAVEKAPDAPPAESVLPGHQPDEATTAISQASEPATTAPESVTPQPAEVAPTTTAPVEAPASPPLTADQEQRLQTLLDEHQAKVAAGEHEPAASGDDLAQAKQAQANAERAASITPDQQEAFDVIAELKQDARSHEDWEYIRQLEHEAEMPVSQRTSHDDEEAVLDVLRESADRGKHADSSPVTDEEHAAAIRELEEDLAPRLAQRNADHEQALDELTTHTEDRIRERDAAVAQSIQEKALAVTELDAQGRRVISIDEAVSLGMGGAGAAGAGQDAAGRIGIEDVLKPELWQSLGHKPMGQEATAISYGIEGIRTEDIAQHGTAMPARASEMALQVAAQRDAAGVGTLGTHGPAGQLEFATVMGPEGTPILEVSIPVRIPGVDEIVVIKTRESVDISTGLGLARDLQTEDMGGRLAQVKPEHLAELKGQTVVNGEVVAESAAPRYMSGEQALARPAEFFEGADVLGIGGGPTSEWAMQHAVAGGAASVEVAGQMPRPSKDSELGQNLGAVEAKIRELVKTGQPVPPELTELHHGIVEQHVENQTAELERLRFETHEKLRQIDELSQAGMPVPGEMSREVELNHQKMNQLKGELDPFLPSRVDRNVESLNDARITHTQADVIHVEPVSVNDPETGLPQNKVKVVYADGTERLVDHVIPSIGANPDVPGGINHLLKGLANVPGIEFHPVIGPDGNVVGLHSVPPGITVSGAVLTGTLGTNMPAELLTRIPADMRDAVITSLVEHAYREGVSAGSRGIVPGIENVGAMPAQMQQILQLPAHERLAALEQFLLTSELTRHDEFGGARRFDDRTLKLTPDQATAVSTNPKAPAPANDQQPAPQAAAQEQPAQPHELRMPSQVGGERTTGEMAAVAAPVGPDELKQISSSLRSQSSTQELTLLPSDAIPALPGEITPTNARKLAELLDAATATRAGREALQRLEDAGVRIEVDTTANGTFHARRPDGSVVHFDPRDFTDPVTLAGVLAHEAHHAATYDTDLKPLMEARGDGAREAFTQGALRNEAEAEVRLMEHHLELRTTTGTLRDEAGVLNVPPPNVNPDHWAAYVVQVEQAGRMLEMRGEAADLNPTERVQKQMDLARKAAEQRMKMVFGELTPSTSYENGVLQPDRPQNYREHYGAYFDQESQGQVGVAPAQHGVDRSLEEIRQGTPGVIRGLDKLDDADVARSLNEQLAPVKAEHVQAIIDRFPPDQQEQARIVLSQSSGFGSMDSFNDLRAAMEPHLQNGGELYVPGSGSLADNVAYTASKHSFDEQPGMSAPTKTTDKIKQGTIVVLDQVVLERIQHDPAFAQSLVDNGCVLLEPHGFNEGINLFSGTSDDEIANRTRQILERSQQNQAEGASFEDTVSTTLSSETREILRGANPELLAQVESVDPVAGNGDHSNEAISKRLSGSAGLPEEKLTEILEHFNPENRKLIRELLAQQGDVFSARRFAQALSEQHDRLTQIAAARGIPPGDVFFYIPERNKSFGMISLAHREVSDTGVGNYINGPADLQARIENGTLTDRTMVVVLDDVSGSGQTLDDATRDLQRAKYEGHAVMSPMVSTEEAYARVENLTIESGTQRIVPREMSRALEESSFYKSLPGDVQDRLVALVQTPRYGENKLSMAFPYMAPDNNNPLFGDLLAKYFIFNETRKASKSDAYDFSAEPF